jgi:16S rRNA (guanine527-N7)-methyltransferase
VDWKDLAASLAPFEIELGADALEKLRALRALVAGANARLNLTRIIDEGEFVERHVLDSLLGLEGSPDAASWVDVGSGGGFPGLAIAIARPRSSVLLVEAIQKKAAFLEEAAASLGLANVSVAAARAEDVARERRERFERGAIRAVGSAALCAEYLLPFLAVGGEAVLYRGPSGGDDEEALARSAAALLGGGEVRAREHVLPSGEKRRLLFVKKTAKTPPAYPRRTGVAAKRPLG